MLLLHEFYKFKFITKNNIFNFFFYLNNVLKIIYLKILDIEIDSKILYIILGIFHI